MTRNSNALMRDEFVLAESDLADFLRGSTDSAINFSGSADLHTPTHPPSITIRVFTVDSRGAALNHIRFVFFFLFFFSVKVNVFC